MIIPTWTIIKKYSIFIGACIIVIISQIILLEPHLKYGFSDVDWGFLSTFKQYRQLYPNIFENFFRTFISAGVYTHQAYYIGIQGDFFDLNFNAYHIVIHVFKILATILAFPLFLIITESLAAAFVATILFAFAYPAVGTMYTVVTSSDYTGVLALNIFLAVYWWTIKKNKLRWYWLIGTLVLILVTLALSTERMYPIFFWLAGGELILLICHKFSREYIKKAYKRILVIFSPALITIVFFPGLILGFLSGNGVQLFNSIGAGNWAHILRPLLAMGSLIIPFNLWHYLGVAKINNVQEYLNFFLRGPMIIFAIFSLIVGIVIFKEVKRFIIWSVITNLLLAFSIYILAVNHIGHFDPFIISPALIGGHTVIFGLLTFIHWFKYQQKEKLLIGIFAGIFCAFSYILLTWVSADNYLNFAGVHRYLTVPALSICLSLGCLMILMVKKLKEKEITERFFLFPLLILIPLILIWSNQITDFFQGQLKQGFGATDQQMMRRQLLEISTNISNKEKSLFYFDFTDDNDNGYYYDSTILGGFGSWMLWHKSINFNRELAPAALWNNFEKLSSTKQVKNGQLGFNVYEHFFPISNFYAVKLKDKKVIDIKNEILKKLDIETIN